MTKKNNTMQPPKYYIKTYYEPRQGFQFEQPVQRLKGKY